MSYRCIIVDDEPLGRKILARYLGDLTQWELAAEFKDCLDVETYLQSNPIDLILLDINLPKIRGTEFLRGLANPPLVIFTTAYSEYAVEAFELEAFDYLVKPISFQRFHRAIQRVQRHIEDKSQPIQWLQIKEGKRMYKVDPSTVSAVQAYGDYVRIHTDDKVYITKDRLTQFKALLPPYFLQVHRSWIVNLSKIQYLEGNQISLGKEMVPVSTSYREELSNRFQESRKL